MLRHRRRPSAGAAAPAVGDDPGRDLHRHIGIEVEGREVAERCGTEGEIRHQPVGDHRRRDTLIEADQVEQRTEAPDTPGKQGRRVAAVAQG